MRFTLATLQGIKLFHAAVYLTICSCSCCCSCCLPRGSRKMFTRKTFATPTPPPLSCQPTSSHPTGPDPRANCAASGRHVDRISLCALITVRQFLNAPLAGILWTLDCLALTHTHTHSLFLCLSLPPSHSHLAWQICTFLLCALKRRLKCDSIFIDLIKRWLCVLPLSPIPLLLSLSLSFFILCTFFAPQPATISIRNCTVIDNLLCQSQSRRTAAPHGVCYV